MYGPGAPYFYLAVAGMALCAGIGIFFARKKVDRLLWFTPAIIGVLTALVIYAPVAFPALFDPTIVGCGGDLIKIGYICPEGRPYQYYLAYLQLFLFIVFVASAAFAGWFGLAIGIWHLLTRTYGDDGRGKDDSQTPL